MEKLRPPSMTCHSVRKTRIWTITVLLVFVHVARTSALVPAHRPQHVDSWRDSEIGRGRRLHQSQSKSRHTVESTNHITPTYRCVLFDRKFQQQQTGIRTCLQSTAGNNNDSSIRRIRRKGKQEVTLYDILGASPKDTQERLKLRYTHLVKNLHPDTNPNSQTLSSSEYDLSEINAAWEILGDKKERLRYDRSLQAKEFTEGVEAMVGLGIKTAIPWLKKTADTTVKAVDITAAAVDASAKAAQEGAEQAKLAYDVFELEQQSKALEQKSSKERLKAQRIQTEIDNMSKKQLATLKSNTGGKTDFGFVEAQRILNNFEVNPIPPALSKELKTFQETESTLKECTKTVQSSKRISSTTRRKVEQAEKAETTARKRLEEAEKALATAQSNLVDAQKAEADALFEEKTAQMNVDKVEQALQKSREKVRTGLSQQQDLYLTKRTKQLQAEKEELIQSANELYREAQALMRQAQDIDRLQ